MHLINESALYKRANYIRENRVEKGKVAFIWIQIIKTLDIQKHEFQTGKEQPPSGIVEPRVHFLRIIQFSMFMFIFNPQSFEDV
jgi:hypothetical protein